MWPELVTSVPVYAYGQREIIWKKSCDRTDTSRMVSTVTWTVKLDITGPTGNTLVP